MSGCDNSNKENIGTDEPEIEAIKIKEEADSIKKEKEKTDSIKAKEKTDSIWAEYETEMSTKENQMKRLEIAVQNQVPQSRFISVDIGGGRKVLVDKRMRTMYLIIHEGGFHSAYKTGYMSILVDSLGKPILYNGPLPD